MTVIYVTQGERVRDYCIDEVEVWKETEQTYGGIGLGYSIHSQGTYMTLKGTAPPEPPRIDDEAYIEVKDFDDRAYKVIPQTYESSLTTGGRWSWEIGLAVEEVTDKEAVNKSRHQHVMRRIRGREFANEVPWDEVIAEMDEPEPTTLSEYLSKKA